MTAKRPFGQSEEAAYFLKVFFVYGCWKAFHAYLWRSKESIESWHNMLTGYEELYASLASRILRVFGYPSSHAGINIYIDPTHSTYIAEHCLAIPSMVVFAGSILIFPGSIRDKLWFIPLGVFLIFCLNLVRIVSLGITMVHVDKEVYDDFHNYIFLGAFYFVVLMMVIWWMERTVKNNQRTVTEKVFS